MRETGRPPGAMTDDAGKVEFQQSLFGFGQSRVRNPLFAEAWFPATCPGADLTNDVGLSSSCPEEPFNVGRINRSGDELGDSEDDISRTDECG